MELLDIINTCEAIIKRRRSDILANIVNNLDDAREFNLSIGRLETHTKFRRRLSEIRKQYQDLIKEVEEIAQQADKI